MARPVLSKGPFSLSAPIRLRWNESPPESPYNILYHNDLYTVFHKGMRDISIEKEFSGWESDFISARKAFEDGQYELNEDIAAIYIFVASLIPRQSAQIAFEAEYWSSVATAMAEIRLNSPTSPRRMNSKCFRVSLDEVQKFANDPMGTWFRDNVAAHVRAISERFGIDVLVNRSEHPFLTSDNPVSITYPIGDAPHHTSTTRGFGFPGHEITFPMSPRLALRFRQGFPKKIKPFDANWKLVFEINYNIINAATKLLISDRENIFLFRASLTISGKKVIRYVEIGINE